VLAQGHQPVDELMSSLAGSGTGLDFEVRAIGDCLAPRTVEEAVLEGLIAASQL